MKEIGHGHALGVIYSRLQEAKFYNSAIGKAPGQYGGGGGGVAILTEGDTKECRENVI